MEKDDGFVKVHHCSNCKTICIQKSNSTDLEWHFPNSEEKSKSSEEQQTIDTNLDINSQKQVNNILGDYTILQMDLNTYKKYWEETQVIKLKGAMKAQTQGWRKLWSKITNDNNER
jgi:transcription initiation factor TFIIIB Brf1 subunit/transcription initiation factor TFIIB